jgi:isoamylase
VRRFWRGDGGTLGAIATRWPAAATCTNTPGVCRLQHQLSSRQHDGFTLNDLVSYKDKHNEANGEGNRDGDNQQHQRQLRRRRSHRKKHQ